MSDNYISQTSQVNREIVLGGLGTPSLIDIEDLGLVLEPLMVEYEPKPEFIGNDDGWETRYGPDPSVQVNVEEVVLPKLSRTHPIEKKPRNWHIGNSMIRKRSLDFNLRTFNHTRNRW